MTVYFPSIVNTMKLIATSFKCCVTSETFDIFVRYDNYSYVKATTARYVLHDICDSVECMFVWAYFERIGVKLFATSKQVSALDKM